MRELLQHYIDGQWIDSEGGERLEVINPATEEACAVITAGTAADVDKAVAAARKAFESFSQTTPDERGALLSRIIEEYKKRMPDIARAVSEEMGAPISFASTAQVGAGLSHFIGAAKALADFEFETDVRGNTIRHEPIGVVGMITPWNWPLNQITAKVGPAIAAGNTMVLKPSEECPTNAAIFAEVMDAAGVPPGVFNLVQGKGPEVGAAISAHRDIDMVSFTGSTRAGIEVAKAAAATVKRVHQELGGKAPNFVLEGADIETVLPPTLQGIIANSGQSCIAPTRLLVHASDAARVEAFTKSVFEGVKVGDPASEGGHIGPLVNKAQFDKVQDLIQSAIDEGARLVTGGTGLPDGTNRGYYIRPTVLADVTPAMRIWREETFGPVATLTSYADVDEGVRLANDTDYGLSATISGDHDAARPVAKRLRAGNVTINTWGPGAGLPFGGYKASGNGREGGGSIGLDEFMEVKGVTFA